MCIRDRRSYFYLGLHGAVGALGKIFTDNKVLLFLLIRLSLGVVCSWCGTRFVQSVRTRFGAGCATSTLVCLAVNPGMFNAGTAYLPSSFAMNAMMVAAAAWMGHTKRDHALAVCAVAAAALVGWPFCALVGLPIALDLCATHGFSWFAVTSLGSFVLCTLPSMLVDWHFYRTVVFAALNILKYNVTASGGAQLYGVEPWSFYFKNLFLNLNLIFVAALASPVLLLLQWMLLPAHAARAKSGLKHAVSPFLLWFVFMSTVPHKEERFMAPVYPAICLCAVLSLQAFLLLTSSCAPQKATTFHKLATWVPWLAAAAVLALSVSRIAALVGGYRAPLLLYKELVALPAGSTLCLGKEWYRFHSSFLVPSGTTVNFVSSGFDGLLPAKFSPTTGSWTTPVEPLNDQNKEEPSRYVPSHTCHFFVDLQEERGAADPRFTTHNGWEVVWSAPFLDAANSDPLPRAFYIPGISSRTNRYNSYVLKKRAKPHN
eukprot:TRINITY_DN3350_c0_g1_i2.p1 TRINITY_DN3350_c0_g1~~TRINITY_DN3350_c0_g1_i2.p1  ORF type:complete len:486 (-),score=108.89 TRINITY_DN3350_c0_g1_i2:4-1461(-)